MADSSNIKPTSGNGLAIVLTVLIAIAVLVWLFAYNGAAQITAPVVDKTPAGNDVSQAKQFIWFNSSPASQYSPISFQYPVGYYVEEPVDSGVAFRAIATMPGEVSEVLELNVDNTTTATSIYEDFKNDLDRDATAYGQIKSTSFTNSRGKLVRVLTGTTLNSILPEFTNTPTHITLAFFDCRNQEGDSYAAMFAAFIPTTWQSDASLFEKTIDTFTC